MHLKIFTDGGARGNPGSAAAAFVTKDEAGILRVKRGKYLGTKTNNEAEYEAVILALEWVNEDLRLFASQRNSALQNLKNKDLRIDFYLDSNLVVSQLNGKFKVKEARLRELLMKVRELMGQMEVSFNYVPREENFEADQLVNETLDE